jgi:2-iminobutanoate/2-iminopropanoate deaminase
MRRLVRLSLVCFVFAVADPGLATQPQRVVVEGTGRLPAFSHATIVGDLIFVSGTLGTLPGAFTLAEGGVGPETTQTIRNIETILASAGATLRDVARCTVYLTDLEDFATMNEAWMPFFGDHPPARAAVGVKELVLGAAVEIECIAQNPRAASK